MSEIKESLSLIEISKAQKEKIYTNIINYKCRDYNFVYSMALCIILILVCMQDITLVENNELQIARMIVETEDYVQSNTYKCSKCEYSNYNRMGDIK
ncbi:MAG: hypothetical protein R3Y13_01315 [bacterium]